MRCAAPCARMPDRDGILLVRLDGLGDAALCIPALEGLSRAFPAARFGAVCSRANDALFSDRVARVFVCDSRRPPETLMAEIRAERYARAVVATEEVVGYRIGRQSGATEIAGFWHGLHKPFKSLWQRSQLTAPVFRPAAWSTDATHEVLALYSLAQALGAEDPPPADPESLRSWMRIDPAPAAFVSKNHLGFQVSRKWFTEGWGASAVTEALLIAMKVSGFHSCALLASAQDEGLACSLIEQIPAAARADGRFRFLGALPMARWLKALDSIAALVTADTGAAHVSGMLGVPVIDVFDAAVFQRLSPQWRPWGAPARCAAKMRWQPDAGRVLGAQIGEAIRDLLATAAVASGQPS
ncbi:MAG: hypothetical protein DLM53_02225 [Candidatus Eremiobacter antarcticus]|nr:MAG: hypothetical protein DLM53_02225 [Candidatus Eremiobacter sp. RRmetagenome_bin22]